MVMGLEKAKALCDKHPELDAYFICAGEGDTHEIHYTKGMEKFMVKR
jgi:thiamine biosynthesis lipoprotein